VEHKRIAFRVDHRGIALWVDHTRAQEGSIPVGLYYWNKQVPVYHLGSITAVEHKRITFRVDHTSGAQEDSVPVG
jgi:hypothetical protein